MIVNERKPLRPYRQPLQTLEITKHKRTIASLNATATEHRAAIDAHSRNFEASTRNFQALEERVRTKDLRIAGLITQNDPLLAARRESLKQTNGIKTLTNNLRITRGAYARLRAKFNTLQKAAAEERSRITAAPATSLDTSIDSQIAYNKRMQERVMEHIHKNELFK